MNIRRSKKNKISYSSIYILIALLIIILCMIIFIPSWSSKVSSSAWDGVVATSFSSGNGTEENPYQISSAGEFAYFKELLQSEDATLYSTKEYVITNSFNYGGYDISINNDIAFTGTVNGKGNIISNAVITNSLFKNIESSTIENINFQKIKLNVNDEGAFLALNAKECNISFLAIEEEINTNDNSKAAGLVFNDESSNFQKILINQTFTSSTSDNKLIAYSLNNTSIDTILNKEDKYENYNNGENVTINNSYNYKIVGSKIKLNDEESISKFITKEYVVNINKDEFIFVDKSVKKPLKSQSNVAVENTTFELHESGIENNTVYINDLEADFNYYDALNYTETGGTLPTFTSLNKYNTSNMVRVMITYDASDGNNTASISLNETENKMVYYKWVPVINNSVRIKLIENPFTNRPNNKGFNNWVSRDDNVVIDFDETLYERYATIPVTKVNNKYEDISVYFNASWVDANVAYISSNNWNSVFDKFDNKQMNKLNIEKVICDDYDMSGYYFEQTAGYFEQYQGYDNRGNYQNTWCWSTTCTYYTLINNENYDSSKTYYELVSGRMRVVDPSDLNLNCETIIDEGYINRNMAGYYVKRNFSYNASYTGYYNNTGQKVTGTCNSSSCTYYELLQTGDNEIYDSNETYYYLVTRDINIAVLNGSFSGNWSRTNNKPFTFTGLYNGVQTSAYWKAISSSGWNSYTQTIYEDTTIENMKIYSTTRKGIENPLTDNSINANYNNLKLGRGITANGNYVSVSGIIGGSSSTSGSNDVKYNIIIESGIYNSASLTYYATSGNGGTIRTNATLTLGNDYDRVTGNNSNLDFNYCVGGSWGGRIYSSSESGINTIVKSGTFGSSKYDLTTGIYVGGRYGGTHYTARTIKVEGGFVYNLIGGPLTASSRSNVNDTYIYQTGGEIDMITGGAGQTATYGNRIIALTGGKVNYSVFAGSNGSTGSGSDGTLNGTGFIYIGGSAVIGDEDLVNNGTKLYGSEAGSVFGIGNGRSGYSSIGSSDNANILITGSSVINNSVYGGGNYGATGVSSNNNSSYTKINITGGTIKKDVYGGGNQNGSGTSSKDADVTINMTDGVVLGSIYGGSNISGTVYGNTNINIIGGTVNTNVYGGGKGNQTFVRDASNVTIGSDNSTLNILGNVYGGSAFGVVNGESTTNASSSNTTVIVNNGIIQGSVFGGGEGNNTYTPYVLGNVKVIINGGNISSVYGGHDKSGSLNKTVEVFLKGGTIGETYGGGNKSSVSVTNVYQEGSNVNFIYGGSNVIGDVETTNVLVTGGVSGNVFGGNNLGGTVGTTNVTINKGTITNSVYGGGNKVSTIKTNVILNGVDGTIPNVYGGGNAADATTVNISQNGADVENLFGGSNTSGSVLETTIIHNSGNTQNIYGGNNEGGNTLKTTINYINGVSANIYGGGNKTNSDTAIINITKGTIGSIYGGGNKAGITNTTINVSNGDITNIYGGSNENGTVNDTTINIENGNIENIYGGNNKGGTTNNPIILITNGNIGNIYGGGNLAPVDKTLITVNNGTIQNIYGGGNEASVLGDTKVDINGGTFNGNIYGGGNYGRVIKNALVTISDANITGSAYAGGNGQTAIVEGNTTIEIDGNTIIGNENTVSPLQGSVFGGGNAAATGLGSNNNSVGTVNIAGGKIYGNVYGGANTSVLYGNSIVNIGIDAINSSNANPVNYNPDTKVYSTDEVEVLFNETFMNTTGGYWDTFLTLTNKLNVGIQDYSLVLYTGSNKLTQCYNCNFTIEGDYTYITPIINWEGQTTMNANESYALNGSWDLTDPSKIYVKEYYSDKSDMYNESSKYKKADIYIKGTIFGGGEANASGSENYDYSFISVTKGINILIDANRYDNFDTFGSIFGSGNASSTSGESKIEIKNYGNINNPHKNISIQRTNDLIIDNSNIALSGAKDRTNEYSDVLFSLSIIDVLRLKNNSALFLENGANLLKKVESLTKDGEIAKVNINDENKTVDKNVDNRIYLLEGRNLNIATNESVTSYGEVYGMTFLGMFTYDRNNNPNMGIYKPTYNYGDTLSWGDMPIKGSYALGLHKANHDIEKDGFYSNFMDDETSTNIVKYVEPTPKDSNFYMWIIGEAVIEYNINLVASKYSTLGAEELTFLEFSKPNTSFQILGFDYSLLLDGVNLKEKNQISKQASTEQEANNNYALVLEPSNQGWLTSGSTTFKTSSPNIVGDTYYMGDSTSIVPSLLFYLYHSKNITESRDLGTVSITVMAITAIDPLTNETRRLVINIDLSTALYQTNEYEAAMAPGDKYNLFTSTTTNITTNSKFSVYYALYGRNTNLYKEGYHRALVSSYAFPEKTKITMLDIIEGSPRYYYHIITKEEEENAINDIRAHNETSYDFSLFTTMGSIGSSKNYSDTEMNQIYYHNGSSDEEFIFIVDFSEANIPSNKLNNSLLVELRNNDDQTIVSVLGIQHEKMRYSLYKNSESVIEAEATIDKNPLYIGNNGVITVSTNYQNLSVSSTTIYDTQYFDSKLGLKITFYDKSGNKVSGNGLMGAYFSVDGKKYYPNVDGTTRIKIADKVGNAKKWIIFNTENASIATGDYTITIETFGSPDGIYYGDKTSSQINIPVTLINSIYGLKSILDEKDVIINTKDQVGDKNMKFVLLYDSGLSNPSLRMTLYRRKYDNVYDTNYEQVDLNDYVDQLLFATNTPNEYILTSNPEAINEFSILLKNNILTGTYRLEFKLYDNDTLIGTVKNYIIIK